MATKTIIFFLLPRGQENSLPHSELSHLFELVLVKFKEFGLFVSEASNDLWGFYVEDFESLLGEVVDLQSIMDVRVWKKVGEVVDSWTFGCGRR